jgi:hypothetical protein
MTRRPTGGSPTRFGLSTVWVLWGNVFSPKQIVLSLDYYFPRLQSDPIDFEQCDRADRLLVLPVAYR